MIKAENVSFSYESEEDEQKILVIDGVDIEVKKGEFLALLGHNGSGKSTLVKMFNAINIPEEGKVFVEGMDTSDEELLYEIRQRVGMVFQNPDNQLVATIVEEDVAFGPENLGVPSEEIRKRVDDALRAVDMTAYTSHAPHMLSGGQKQRIAIAGILAMKPDCIILDESTAMLDPMGRREVIKTVTDLNKKTGITVVLITHYMEEAALADRIVVMSGGKAVSSGTPHEVFSDVEKMKELKLGVPQATELAYELKKRGVNFDTVLDAKEFLEEFKRIKG